MGSCCSKQKDRTSTSPILSRGGQDSPDSSSVDQYQSQPPQSVDSNLSKKSKSDNLYSVRNTNQVPNTNNSHQNPSEPNLSNSLTERDLPPQIVSVKMKQSIYDPDLRRSDVDHITPTTTSSLSSSNRTNKQIQASGSQSVQSFKLPRDSSVITSKSSMFSSLTMSKQDREGPLENLPENFFKQVEWQLQDGIELALKKHKTEMTALLERHYLTEKEINTMHELYLNSVKRAFSCSITEIQDSILLTHSTVQKFYKNKLLELEQSINAQLPFYVRRHEILMENLTKKGRECTNASINHYEDLMEAQLTKAINSGMTLNLLKIHEHNSKMAMEQFHQLLREVDLKTPKNWEFELRAKISERFAEYQIDYPQFCITAADFPDVVTDSNPEQNRSSLDRFENQEDSSCWSGSDGSVDRDNVFLAKGKNARQNVESIKAFEKHDSNQPTNSAKPAPGYLHLAKTEKSSAAFSPHNFTSASVGPKKSRNILTKQIDYSVEEKEQTKKRQSKAAQQFLKADSFFPKKTPRFTTVQHSPSRLKSDVLEPFEAKKVAGQKTTR